jgi:hypothetical protein
MRVFLDLGLTTVCGAFFGVCILKLSDQLHLPILEEQRTLFLIGTILFAVASRLLISLHEERE